MEKLKSLRIGERATDIYISVMLLAYPLFTGFYGYSKITESKLAFYLVATALWVLALLAGLFLDREKPKIKMSLEAWLILGYLALCCLSALLSPFGARELIIGAGRFDGLLQIFLCVLIFFGIRLYGEFKRRYVYFLCASMSLCCLVAVFQFFGLNPLGLFPSNYTFYNKTLLYSGEFLGTIGNANLLSAYLCLCLPVLLFTYMRGGVKGIIALPCLFLGSICMFECTVSAGKLALLVCLLIAPAFLLAGHKSLSRLLRGLGTVALSLTVSLCFSGKPMLEGTDLSFRLSFLSCLLFSVGMAALALSLFPLFSNLEVKKLRTGFFALSLLLIFSALSYVYTTKSEEGTVYEFSQVLHGEVRDSFGSSRIRIWRETLALLPDRPLTGGGPGTLPLRVSIVFERYFEATGKTLQSSVDNAHNVYLGILTDCGIPALLLYISAIAVTLIKAARRAERRPFPAALCCGLLAYWVQDFFGLGLFIVSPVAWIFWALAGTDERKENFGTALPGETRETESPLEASSDISPHEDTHD